MVQNCLHESPDTVIDMKCVNITHNNMIESFREPVNYKRYLKQLFKENIPGVIFIQQLARKSQKEYVYLKPLVQQLKRYLKILGITIRISLKLQE